MINWRVISKTSGMLLIVEVLLLLASMGSALFYHEDVMPFVWAILACAAVGGAGIYYGRHESRMVGRKDSYIRYRHHLLHRGFPPRCGTKRGENIRR